MTPNDTLITALMISKRLLLILIIFSTVIHWHLTVRKSFPCPLICFFIFVGFQGFLLYSMSYSPVLFRDQIDLDCSGGTLSRCLVLLICPHHSISISLLSGISCSMVILYFSWPSHRISYLCPNPSLLLAKDSIWIPKFGCSVYSLLLVPFLPNWQR